MIRLEVGVLLYTTIASAAAAAVEKSCCTGRTVEEHNIDIYRAYLVGRTYI